MSFTSYYSEILLGMHLVYIYILCFVCLSEENSNTNIALSEEETLEAIQKQSTQRRKTLQERMEAEQAREDAKQRSHTVSETVDTTEADQKQGLNDDEPPPPDSSSDEKLSGDDWEDTPPPDSLKRINSSTSQLTITLPPDSSPTSSSAQPLTRQESARSMTNRGDLASMSKEELVAFKARAKERYLAEEKRLEGLKSVKVLDYTSNRNGTGRSTRRGSLTMRTPSERTRGQTRTVRAKTDRAEVGLHLASLNQLASNLSLALTLTQKAVPGPIELLSTPDVLLEVRTKVAAIQMRLNQAQDPGLTYEANGSVDQHNFKLSGLLAPETLTSGSSKGSPSVRGVTKPSLQHSQSLNLNQRTRSTPPGAMSRKGLYQTSPTTPLSISGSRRHLGVPKSPHKTMDIEKSLDPLAELMFGDYELSAAGIKQCSIKDLRLVLWLLLVFLKHTPFWLSRYTVALVGTLNKRLLQSPDIAQVVHLLIASRLYIPHTLLRVPSGVVYNISSFFDLIQADKALHTVGCEIYVPSQYWVCHPFDMPGRIIRRVVVQKVFNSKAVPLLLRIECSNSGEQRELPANTMLVSGVLEKIETGTISRKKVLTFFLLLSLSLCSAVSYMYIL